MIVDDTCPRCGKAISRGHRAHLLACGGERPPRQPRPSDREELAVRVRGRDGKGAFRSGIHLLGGVSHTCTLCPPKGTSTPLSCPALHRS